MKNRYFFIETVPGEVWEIRERLSREKFEVDSEHFTKEAVAKRTAFLNGKNMSEYAYV